MAQKMIADARVRASQPRTHLRVRLRPSVRSLTRPRCDVGAGEEESWRRLSENTWQPRIDGDEAHRDRFDCLRLPDVVSREVAPSTSSRSPCSASASASSSIRWTSGAAAARPTSPTRSRCSASGRNHGHGRPGFRRVPAVAGCRRRRHVARAAGRRQVHRVVLLQHRHREQPDRVVLHRRDGSPRQAVIPHDQRAPADWSSHFTRTIQPR